ncbi:MAG: protein BatD [Proteobacteria bacterium]|nr:protein BatD [Pseudomonadota bacterium]
MRGRVPGILLLLIGCAAAAQALAGVTASLNASRVASGNTVQLTLEHDGRTSGQPDVTPLERDFDILGTSSSTTYELFNGSASEKTQFILTLAPKATGRLTIPPLSWDGEHTGPLSLTVTGPGGASQSGSSAATPAANVFIETTTSPERPYVEAAVNLTVRLFTSEPLYRADLELPDNSNFVVKQIGPDEDGSAERNGRNYQVVTRRYLVFPLHSGRLTLQGPVLDAEVPIRQSRSPFGNDPFGGRMFSGFLRTVQPVRVHGNPIVLAVQPRPAGAVGSYWLPARKVTLSAAWNPAKLTARAGDPVTLDLDLQATGLTAAQLPDLSSLLSLPSALQAYPDQAKLHDSSRNGQLIGSRDQTIALMASSPGHYTIPGLTVRWWDTRANQPRTATLPAQALTILPAPSAALPAGTATAASAPAVQPTPAAAASRHVPPAATARKPAPARSPSEWEWISIGLAAVWLGTLGAWLWSRRSRSAPPARPGGSAHAPTAPSSPNRAPSDPARERSAFRAACQANDAPAARAHLLAWTGAVWGAAPAGINAIAARIGDTTIVELLRDLDRACYAGGSWQGEPLAAALTKLLPAAQKTARARDGLAPLYP